MIVEQFVQNELARVLERDGLGPVSVHSFGLVCMRLSLRYDIDVTEDTLTDELKSLITDVIEDYSDELYSRMEA